MASASDGVGDGVGDGTSDPASDKPPVNGWQGNQGSRLSGGERLFGNKEESSKAASARETRPTQSWSSVARDDNGSNRSGDRMVSKEELARLKKVFAEALIFPKDELEEARDEWRGKTLIGRFLSRKFDFNFVAKALLYRWKLKGDVEIIPTTNGFYLFRFTCVDDYTRVRSGGPTMVGGAVLALEEWRENFKPNRDIITKATVWLRMPGLPSEYWKRKFVLAIASKAGHPIEVDLCTESMLRGGFARVCVEVDLLSPLVAGTPVGPPEEQIFQEFVYEGIGLYCFRCGVIGHGIHECKCDPNGVKRMVAKVVDSDGMIHGESVSEEMHGGGDRESGKVCNMEQDGVGGPKTAEEAVVGELYGPWLAVPSHRRRSTQAGAGGPNRSNKLGQDHGGKSGRDDGRIRNGDSMATRNLRMHGGHAEKDLHVIDAKKGGPGIVNSNSVSVDGLARDGLKNDLGGPKLGRSSGSERKLEKIKIIGTDNTVVQPRAIFNWAESFPASPGLMAPNEVVFSSAKGDSPVQTRLRDKPGRSPTRMYKGPLSPSLRNRFELLTNGEEHGDDTEMADNETIQKGNAGNTKRRRSGEAVQFDRHSHINLGVESGVRADGDKENQNVNLIEGQFDPKKIGVVHGDSSTLRAR